MGPGDEVLTKMAVMIKIGENKAKMKREPAISMVLLKILKMNILCWRNNLDFLFIIFGDKEVFVFSIGDYLTDEITNIEAFLNFTNEESVGGVDNGQVFDSNQAD